MFKDNCQYGRFAAHSILLMCFLWMLAGCDRPEKAVSKSAILSELDVWTHTGNQDTQRLLKDQVARFNASHSRIRVKLISIPKGTYNAQINAAIRTGTLPDIVELDGPYLPSFTERGALIKLDKMLTDSTRQDMLPAVFKQGMYQGRVYSLATTSNSPVMYARKSAIQAAGYRIPGVSKDAWDMTEFEGLLASLLKSEVYSAAIDLGINQQGERISNALHPVLLSSGGGMIDETTPYAGQGVLNNDQNLAALRRIQQWIDDGYIDNNTDDGAFVGGRVALSWAGLEKYASYKNAFGDDLVMVPLPDFGVGSQRTQRAWGWGLTRNCEDTQAAMRFLEFLFQPEEVLLAAEANATLPATLSALARFDAFSETPSILTLIEDHKNGRVLSQQQSPLYPVISDAFQKAFIRIRNGAVIESSLNTAIKVIDEGRQKLESELEIASELAR